MGDDEKDTIVRGFWCKNCGLFTVDWKKLAIPNLALVSEGSWSTVDGMLLYMKVTLRLTLVIQKQQKHRWGL